MRARGDWRELDHCAKVGNEWEGEEIPINLAHFECDISAAGCATHPDIRPGGRTEEDSGGGSREAGCAPAIRPS